MWLRKTYHYCYCLPVFCSHIAGLGYAVFLMLLFRALMTCPTLAFGIATFLDCFQDPPPWSKCAAVFEKGHLADCYEMDGERVWRQLLMFHFHQDSSSFRPATPDRVSHRFHSSQVGCVVAYGQLAHAFADRNLSSGIPFVLLDRTVLAPPHKFLNVTNKCSRGSHFVTDVYFK